MPCARRGWINSDVMRMIGIILVAGPVLCGACSIKRQAESQRTVSTELSALETRTGIRRDSLVGSLGRAVRLDRRWIALEPNSGTVYRYDERMYIDETAGTASGSMKLESVTAQREEFAEQEEHRSVEAHSETRGVSWWWVAAIGLVALLAVRLFRFWPFK